MDVDCRINMDIMTGEKLSLIQVANMGITLICCSFSRRKEDGVKGVEGGNRYFSQLHFSLFKDIDCRIYPN